MSLWKLFIFLAWWLLFLKCSWISSFFSVSYSVSCHLLLLSAYFLQYLDVLLESVGLKVWWHRQTCFTKMSFCGVTIEFFPTELAKFCVLSSILVLYDISAWVVLNKLLSSEMCNCVVYNIYLHHVEAQNDNQNAHCHENCKAYVELF